MVNPKINLPFRSVSHGNLPTICGQIGDVFSWLYRFTTIHFLQLHRVLNTWPSKTLVDLHHLHHRKSLIKNSADWNTQTNNTIHQSQSSRKVSSEETPQRLSQKSTSTHQWLMRSEGHQLFKEDFAAESFNIRHHSNLHNRGDQLKFQLLIVTVSNAGF